jgi:hypothetical protein
MLRFMATALLIDTYGLLVMTLALNLVKKREQAFLRFLRKKRFLIFALFPWLPLIVWLEKPGRRLRQNVWSYRVCYVLSTLGAMALVVIGVFLWDDGIADGGMTLFLWILILDGLIRDDHGGNDDHHDDEPPPDPTTPTGDAAEHWLQRRQTLTDPSLQPSRSR